MNRSEISGWFVALLALSTTVSYMFASSYLAMLWSSLVSDPINIPTLSAWTIRPISRSMEYFMLHWHLAAFASLLINGWWARRRLAANSSDGIALPLACHLAWLVFALCLHITGVLASIVSVAYVIE